MEELINLINILQITRSMPQYGYAFAGGNARLGSLAEHHYLVTMLSWQMAENLNKKGANLDINKVFKFALLHDIGEIFGGDIGMYYAKANPEAKRLAKEFEEENQRYVLRFFSDKEELIKLSKEILNSDSDEAHVVKIADYLEVTHYKLFTNSLKKKDVELVAPKLLEKVAKIENQLIKEELLRFVDAWKDKMSKYDSYLDASTDALGM